MARCQALSEAQRAAAAAERHLGISRPSLESALNGWRSAVKHAIGRAQLPSTVLGAIVDAAEHAARHAGQVVTTAKLVRASGV